MATKSYEYLLEVPSEPTKDGAPTRSPAYRNSKHATPPTGTGEKTLFEVFESSVKRFGDKPCLGHRPIGPDGKAQDYVWLTYKEVQTKAASFASALKGLGVQKHQRVAVMGVNCPEWMLTIQVCSISGCALDRVSFCSFADCLNCLIF